MTMKASEVHPLDQSVLRGQKPEKIYTAVLYYVPFFGPKAANENKT